ITTPVTYGRGTPKPTTTLTCVCAAIGAAPSASAIPVAKSRCFMGHLRRALSGRVMPDATAPSQRQLLTGVSARSAEAAGAGACHLPGSRLSAVDHAATRRWRGDVPHQPHDFHGLGVASQRVPLGPDVAEGIAVPVVVGALARRYGIALPGNGFSSYILGVTAYAVLDRGWPFGILVAPLAMVAGDLALRRLPVAAALDNAAHLTTGAAVAGLAYARLGGATGAQALAAGNLVPLVVFLVLLPCIVNGTFYMEHALGRTLAWVDAALTARWEAVVYACSVGLALASLQLAHAGLDMVGFVVIGVVIVSAAVASVSVVRRGVHADELSLIQSLSQAIARVISLVKSFTWIQVLARRLVPWEQMGFARYHAGTNEMELVADTATGERGGGQFRFDANAGLSG